ncbi:MAG TPA: phospholipase D-like domain-containing protein [Thermoanaerobaculia bacterium]|nr:phospholipase D-like domain-containing protein [Thermoanaerobaculia bacterium]
MRFALILSIAVAVVLALILWSRTRRRNVHFDFPDGGDVSTLMHSIAALTWGHVVEGNAVRIIQDEAFFEELIGDMASAAHHVHLETFLWEDGFVSDMIVPALIAAAQRGIEVRVLVDHRGAKTTSPAVWARLTDGGVDFRVYHRARLRELGFYNNRDHRKIAVIDGCIGYTFGHGIADMWGGRNDRWRDTAARFEGPVVRELQTAFLENWTKVQRTALAAPEYFPPLEPKGTIPMHVAWAAPPETASAVQRLYYMAISAARREIIMQNPYFIPDSHAVQLYADAVKRGVTVRLMLPTSGTSDFPIVQHASHYYYGRLLAAGAVIHEYARAGLHQKVLIVDREWCTIGSTNFDPRSFRINDEISVAIYDRGVAEELTRAFEEDAKHAEEWTLERWNARRFTHRVVDAMSRMLKRQL